MKQLIVEDEQAEVIRDASEKVEVRDPTGRIIDYITPVPNAEEIVRAQETMEEKRCHTSS